MRGDEKVSVTAEHAWQQLHSIMRRGKSCTQSSMVEAAGCLCCNPAEYIN